MKGQPYSNYSPCAGIGVNLHRDFAEARNKLIIIVIKIH